MNIEKLFCICDEIVPDEKGCRKWPMALVRGYPQAGVGNRKVKVTRVLLERKLGRKIHTGLMALHECDNRWCVSEEHLWEGNHEDNMRDMKNKGRAASGERNGKTLHPESTPRGLKHHRSTAKLCAEDIPIIRELLLEYSCCDIAKRYSVGRMTISRIRDGESWIGF